MKNRKGFTLIELLAVIVILGLLMAIAIPSVTKYITQSRKKIVTTTIGNYISALTNQVNDMEYTFTATNTVYAVPIECIALERGGTNPFGKWHQSNDAYWAYVLVQYDDNTSSYTYGFTFKDSAGYGLYPTTIEKLNESGSQIQTGLSLNRPTGNSITNITVKENWTGFDIEDDTNLIVLEAASEGETGDGKTTCTLCQKGSNYDNVEKEKEEKYLNTTTAYALYFEETGLLNFVRSSKIIKENDIYNGLKVSEVYTGFENVFYQSNSIPWYKNREKIMRVVFENKIQPISTAFWFYQFKNCEYIDLTNLDTSNVTSMSYMFYWAGINKTNFNISGLNELKTGKVTNMSNMFYYTGRNVTNFNYDLSDWDVSKVRNMGWMFCGTGENSINFSIGDLKKWDTSNVTTMQSMFLGLGSNSTNLNIGDISNWNTSKVTNMRYMFNGMGRNTKNFKLDLSGWDTSKVTDMSSMFKAMGNNSNSFILTGLENWNVSNVTSMERMFESTGENSTTFGIGNLGNWNTSKVTNMSYMFSSAGYNANTFKIEGINNWNVSNVTDMNYMFSSTGYNSRNFNLNLTDWNTSKVTNMGYMFYHTGYKATSFSIGNLSNWNVSSVTNMAVMFDSTGYNAKNFNIGNLKNWDTSSVESMSVMFYKAGYNSNTFYIGDLSTWDTSNVTSVGSMFNQTGYKAAWSLNCSNWNVDKVTSYSNFNNGVTSKVTPPKWVN